MRFPIVILLIILSLSTYSQSDSIPYKWNIRAGSYFNPKTPSYQNYYPYYFEMTRNIKNKQWGGIRLSYLPEVRQGHIYNSYYTINEEINGYPYTQLMLFVNTGWALGLEPDYSIYFRLLKNYVYCYLSTGIGLHVLNNKCIDNTIKNIAFSSFSLGAGLELRHNHFAITCEPLNTTLILFPEFGNGSYYGSVSLSYYFNLKTKK